MRLKFIPYYILEDRIPVPCYDGAAFAAWMTTNNICVGDTQIGRCRVSTVFLGLPMPTPSALFVAFGQSAFDPPLLFETMCFRGDFDEAQMRYATWDLAEQGHQEMVCIVKMYRAVMTRRGFKQMVDRMIDRDDSASRRLHPCPSE